MWFVLAGVGVLFLLSAFRESEGPPPALDEFQDEEIQTVTHFVIQNVSDPSVREALAQKLERIDSREYRELAQRLRNG